MAAVLQPDRAVIVEPEPDGVSALGEIEGLDRMTGCGRQRLSGFRRSCEACSRLLARVGERGLTEARKRTKPDEYTAVMAYLLSYDCVLPAGGGQQPFPAEDVPTLTSVELGTGTRAPK